MAIRSEVTVYIPSKKEFLFISEGTGDNLLPEDRAEGYVDYVNIDVYAFVGEPELSEMDGGMMMLDKYYQDAFSDDEDLVSKCIQYQYDKDIEYIEIEPQEVLV